MLMNIKWHIEKWTILDLKEWAKNPRLLTKKGIEYLTQSISKFGLAEPIVINTDGTILGGHARVKVLKLQGETECDCYVPDRTLTEREVEEINIRLNANTAGIWDIERLANEWELSDLKDWGMNTEAWEGNEATEDDFEMPETIETDIVKGDLFHIGQHRILCGDSTKAEDVDKLMNGEKADVVITDPPYGMFLDTDFSKMKGSLGRKGGTKGKNYEKVIGDNEDFNPNFITTIFDLFSSIKEIFLFGADYFSEFIPDKNEGSWFVWDKRKESQADAFGSEFELIWSKQKHKRRMLRFDWFGFLSSKDGKDARNRVHPTQKPVSLITELIKDYSKDN